MFLWFHRLGSPSYFYGFSGTLLVWLTVLTVLLVGAGLVGGLVLNAAEVAVLNGEILAGTIVGDLREVTAAFTRTTAGTNLIVQVVDNTAVLDGEVT